MKGRIYLDLKRYLVLVAAATFLGVLCGFAGEPDSLENAFLVPPASAKPTIWWFWGESVTTDHGITLDLEALKRVGFGGVVIYEQVFADAPDALKSLSPEWLARVKFAAAECARLGMTLEVNACSGYVAGGPWITPALGMQRLVSSELQVDGGRKFSGVLPQPPTKLDYYRDVAVLAFPAPAGDDTHRAPPTLESTPAIHGLKRYVRSIGAMEGGDSPRTCGPAGVGPDGLWPSVYGPRLELRDQPHLQGSRPLSPSSRGIGATTPPR